MKYLTKEWWTTAPDWYSLPPADKLFVGVFLAALMSPLVIVLWDASTRDERRIEQARMFPHYYRCLDTRDGEVFTFSTPNITRWGAFSFTVIDDNGREWVATRASEEWIKCREYTP